MKPLIAGIAISLLALCYLTWGGPTAKELRDNKCSEKFERHQPCFIWRQK